MKLMNGPTGVFRVNQKSTLLLLLLLLLYIYNKKRYLKQHVYDKLVLQYHEM